MVVALQECYMWVIERVVFLNFDGWVCQALNKDDKTWDVALDISKAFDRVWHDGLIHKFKGNSFLGVLGFFFQGFPLI